jgi:hypothetical protein
MPNIRPEAAMRWIDIPLPPSGSCPEFDRHVAHGKSLLADLPRLQERAGLDSAAVVEQMTLIGQDLFQGVTAYDAAAFRPDPGRDGGETSACGRTDVDCLVGYHLVADRDQLNIPWHWLHNGVEFLLARSPICAAAHGSRVPAVDPDRIWMHRFSEESFAQSDTAPATLDDRPAPEILFVPGHGNDEVRRLMFREAEGIDDALRGAPRAVARLRIPGAVTPGLLASRAMLYQALHFTSPTSQHPSVSGAGEHRWLSGLIAAAHAPGLDTMADVVGMEFEVLGVDPVEAMLDQVSERRDAMRSAPQPELVGALGAYAAAGIPSSGWLLEDGPFVPESLAHNGALPALIFSNSYCGLTSLGRRFLEAGTSTFVGPAAPLFSRPARRFAAAFYTFLAEGHGAASAVRSASLALRNELGADHPAWLSYGVVGYGSLALRHI